MPSAGDRPSTLESLAYTNECCVVNADPTSGSGGRPTGLPYGLVDQLEDRLVCNQEATGSNPVESIPSGTTDFVSAIIRTAHDATRRVWNHLGALVTQGTDPAVPGKPMRCSVHFVYRCAYAA